jgi:hypothetical protein
MGCKLLLLDSNKTKLMRKYFVAFAILLSACSWSTVQATPLQNKKLVEVINAVDLKAGITQQQAIAMSELYFINHISGCGFADTPVDRGRRWEVTPRIGYAGAPNENPIIIEKHTGKISWKSGPTFMNISALLRAKT